MQFQNIIICFAAASTTSLAAVIPPSSRSEITDSTELANQDIPVITPENLASKAFVPGLGDDEATKLLKRDGGDVDEDEQFETEEKRGGCGGYGCHGNGHELHGTGFSHGNGYQGKGAPGNGFKGVHGNGFKGNGAYSHGFNGVHGNEFKGNGAHGNYYHGGEHINKGAHGHYMLARGGGQGGVVVPGNGNKIQDEGGNGGHGAGLNVGPECICGVGVGKNGNDGHDGHNGQGGKGGKDGKDGNDGHDGKDGNGGKGGKDGHNGQGDNNPGQGVWNGKDGLRRKM